VTATVVLGIDGGQSETRWAIAFDDGRVLRRGTLPPLDPDGMKRHGDSAISAVNEVFTTAASEGLAIQFAVIASTTIDPALAPNSDFVGAFRTLPGRISVVGDEEAAWAGATGMKPGIAAMAGTGSVVVARDASGNRARVGGHGALFADLGSGWHIASLAVRAGLTREDRGQPATDLDRRVLSELEAGSFSALSRLAATGAIGTARIASVASSLIGDQDPEARRHVEKAATALADQVAIAAERLPSPHADRLPVHLSGRVGQANGFAHAFSSALGQLLPHAAVMPPVLSNLGGAVLLAIDAAGGNLHPALTMLEAGQLGYPRSGSGVRCSQQVG
jgi:glucosamine kinase